MSTERDYSNEEVKMSIVSTATALTRVSRACTSCRSLKIRCFTASNSSECICENCERSNRECVFTPLVKTRRRKRADVRVKELENEVRLLNSVVRKANKTPHLQTPISLEQRYTCLLVRVLMLTELVYHFPC